MKKTAVILFNLGGPDSLGAVRPFLFNLFNDPAIIRLPWFLRIFIASLISSRREKTAQDIYRKIGGHSPILENTQAQARALELKLGSDYKCFIAMRYWQPFTEQVARDVKKYAPDEIILLPLYPQFSTTTSASSLKLWNEISKKIGLKAPTKTICCYPTDHGFISALAASTRAIYEQAGVFGAPRILFSAHGLPEKIVKSGDPYQWQCEQTAVELVKSLAIPNLDWTLCYQSRVGPLKWITPSTDQEVVRAGVDKVPLIVVPIAFVSEHSETLVEIDMEYRHMAEKCGVPFYAYVPTVSVAPAFISGLANLVQTAQSRTETCTSDSGVRICPPKFSGCCTR